MLKKHDINLLKKAIIVGDTLTAKEPDEANPELKQNFISKLKPLGFTKKPQVFLSLLFTVIIAWNLIFFVLPWHR